MLKGNFLWARELDYRNEFTGVGLGGGHSKEGTLVEGLVLENYIYIK